MEYRDRNKKFLGAAIGLGLNVATSIISAKKKKKAEELAYNKQLDQQTKAEGLNQAQVLTDSMANQEFVDEYKNKITMENGGKVKFTDRSKKFTKTSHTKRMKFGGRDKKNIGGLLGKEGVSSAIGGGASNIVSALMQSTKPPKTVDPSVGFTTSAPKTSLTPADYQIDESGNPIVNPTSLTPNLVRNTGLAQARYGKRKRLS